MSEMMQNERLARLEQNVVGLQGGQAVIHKRIDRTNAKVDDIQTAVDKMSGAVGIIKWATIVGATLAGGILLKVFEVI